MRFIASLPTTERDRRWDPLQGVLVDGELDLLEVG
jgi:hypothetical protein